MFIKRDADRRGVAGDDTELNMTPMIDIVFQLIVFFLLSLKFKDVDRRLEAMLPNWAGIRPSPQPPPEFDKVKVKVFRRDLHDPRRVHTLVKVDNAARFRLPEGWRGRRKEPAERRAAYDRVLAAVRAQIDQRVAAHGRSDLKGEIVAPPPRGGSVPHGDVVALVDLFLQAGITEVIFEGQMRPLNKREREARARARR